MPLYTSSALIQVSHRSHNTCTANCHVCSKGKRNRAQREALVEPWFKHLNYCGWWKGISTDEATFNSEEIKPVAIAIIKLHVSEGISRSVSQSVSQSASQPVSQSASQPVSQSASQSVLYDKSELQSPIIPTFETQVTYNSACLIA